MKKNSTLRIVGLRLAAAWFMTFLTASAFCQQEIPQCGVETIEPTQEELEEQFESIPTSPIEDLEKFGEVSLSDDENAYTYYKRALTLHPPAADDEETTSEIRDALETTLYRGIWNDAPPEVRRWLERSREALQVWREGTSKDNAVYFQPRDVTLETELLATQPTAILSRLALLEGMRLRHLGKVEDAWTWYIAAIRCSRHLGKNGCGIERLVGVVALRGATSPLLAWMEDRKVTEALLIKAVDDFRRAAALTPAFSESLRTEYFMVRKAMVDVPGGVPGRIVPAERMEELLRERKLEGNKTPFYPSTRFYVQFEPELSQKIYALTIANWLTNADQPTWLRPKMLNRTIAVFDVPVAGVSAPELEEWLTRTIYCMHLFPAVRTTDAANTCDRTRIAVLDVLFTAALHYRRSGKFPDRIEELYPQSGPSIPLDPYGHGEPIRYRRDQDTVIVWGVGPDRVDDDAEIDAQFYVKPKTNGDYILELREP